MKTITKALLLAAAAGLSGCASLEFQPYPIVRQGIEQAEALCEPNGGIKAFRSRRGYWPRSHIFEGECASGLTFRNYVQTPFQPPPKR
jgi:hypothetical protein